jgi:hypothetical protein
VVPRRYANRSRATAMVASRASTCPRKEHHLQWLARNAAQREVAERLGGKAHPRETQQPDLTRLREAPRPGPRAREVPEAAEQHREGQRDAKTPHRRECRWQGRGNREHRRTARRRAPARRGGLLNVPRRRS